jgi:ornithine--oxo-acid transaminase
MKTQDYIDLENQYGAHNYHPLDVVVERAEGAWVYDVEGKRYLDCLASYSAVNQGHCHPKILNTLVEQAHRVTLTSRAFRNDQLPLLYKELHDLTGLDMALPMNSGAEAVETAVKTARKWGYTVKGIPEGQAEIIVCENNFHGRTTTIVGFSTEPQYRSGNAGALRAAITPNTCGFLVEPIQGEAGIIIPPEGYLREAAEACREHRVLLMLDEIQSGLGRTGKLFTYMYEQVAPDVLIVGKALSGGFYPVSACLASKEIMGVYRPGDHGSTFGGNPLGCAVARTALKVLVEEHLIENSAELGAYFLDRLRTIDSPHVKQVRGLGLWIGVELHSPARPFCEALRDEGLLCKETHERVIRFAPPLVITRGEIDWAFERVKRVLETR